MRVGRQDLLIISLIAIYILIRVWREGLPKVAITGSLILFLLIIAGVAFVIVRRRLRLFETEILEVSDGIFVVPSRGAGLAAMPVSITPLKEEALIDMGTVMRYLSDLGVSLSLIVSASPCSFGGLRSSYKGALFKRIREGDLHLAKESLMSSFRILKRVLGDEFSVEMIRMNSSLLKELASTVPPSLTIARRSLVAKMSVPHGAEMGEAAVCLDEEACVSLGDIAGHVLVTGATGSGKTTTVKRILYELWTLYGVPFIVLDFHNEYGDLMKKVDGSILAKEGDCYSYSINILEDLDETDGEELYYFVDAFKTILDLTPAQEFMLLTALGRLRTKAVQLGGPPSIGDLYEEIAEIEIKTPSEGEAKSALLRKIFLLREEPLSSLISCNGTGLAREISSPVSIELDDVSTETGKLLYVHFFLRRMYGIYKSMGFSKTPRVVLVIEEADKCLPAFKEESGLTMGEKLFSEMRKYGISLICIVQSSSKISKYIVQNTSIKILHRAGEPRDVEFLRGLIGGGKEKTGLLWKLRPGEFVLIHGNRISKGKTRPISLP